MQRPVANQCHAVGISHWYTAIQRWAKAAFCIADGDGLVGSVMYMDVVSGVVLWSVAVSTLQTVISPMR